MLTLVRLKEIERIRLFEVFLNSLEILIVGIGLLVGYILSWTLGLSGGDVFVWIFCLYLGLEVGKIIFSDDSNDDDDDYDGGILTPAYQGI